ncbi:alpha/beta hydrolase [Rhodococcus sp. D2-41]|uniref:Alpha/beta fold hydrolase n=1 Tax=Speluncibacter jeojiensis TaxID=2710754 RepID=A0A9X4RDZ1_9ACTN|nr:alpha/beta hydrolase [Rhodococcus sp. D2-41]MDG3009867.1 alpha/beta hydrolase [Rhodococcus sp. D2-41]MDG3014617.1 alpha/beta fold hydrolase [Corynebacteriales bacterium D3-21]
MAMRSGMAEVGGIRLAYEDLGDVDDPPVVLIMGFASQLITWPIALVRRLVDAGFRVIRYDNRDIGLSTKLDGAHIDGSRLLRLARYELGLPSPSPYTLVDMAADTRGLLDHLGIDRAHVVGASMGGMIAQIVAAEHSDRVRSLAIMFSSTNQPLLPPPAPRALRRLLASPGKNPTREQVIDMTVRSNEAISSPKYPQPQQVVRERAAEAYDRSYHPAGVVRQFAATLGTGSLLGYTRRITAPSVVLHGTADPLMRPAGGKAIARAIRGARLHLIDGWAHDLPPELHEQIAGILVSNMRRAAETTT